MKQYDLPQLHRCLAEKHLGTTIEPDPFDAIEFIDEPQRLSDDEVLRRASNAANSDKFLNAWHGNWRQLGHLNHDASLVDSVLVRQLAFYSRNREQVIRLWRQSPIGQREKTQTRHDYVDRTVNFAFEQLARNEAAETERFAVVYEELDSINQANANETCLAVNAPVTNYESPVVSNSLNSSDSSPVLAPEAFHGLAGGFVKLIEPETEADPAAILLQLLVAIGCYFGRLLWFPVEATKHFPNLFCLVVGDTAKARKGTSWGWVELLFTLIDPAWINSNCRSGVVSGEGLLFHTRDPINADDPGVKDKRLLIQEDEFSQVMKVSKRDSNTTTDQLRKAWDGKHVLATLAKNNAIKATGAHISLIGHITKMELSSLLDRTDIFNGLLNRFLIVLVKRSKLLPHGGNVDQTAFNQFAEQFRAVFCHYNNHAEVRRSIAANQFWERIYPELSEAKPGMVGAITARGEAQVMRLALIYALLDRSPTIEPVHLTAALAVWNYSLQSCQILFGEFCESNLSQRILACIQQAAADGLTRTQLSNALQRNFSSSQIQSAINELESSNRILVQRTGRTTRYLATKGN